MTIQVRQKTLLKLLTLTDKLFNKNSDRKKIVQSLHPDTVMNMIGVSRRTAYDYITALQYLYCA
jgi:hypothetical protein